jgi:protease YdgD
LEEITMLTRRTHIWDFAALSALALAAAIGARPLLGSGHVHLVGIQTEAETKAADVFLRHIVDARLKPYAAVGKFEGAMACTAAIVVDPRIIVTAGHCITERDGSIRKSRLSFRLGYQAGTELGRFAATVWAVGSKQSFKRQSVHNASQDWVILVLDRAPKGVEPFVLGDHSFDALKARERELFMPSYSNDIGDAEFLVVDPACSIRDLVWDVLIHDCRGRFGSSGAPLLLRDRLQPALVGIHTGSMFASDDAGHVAKFVGNRAIGTWTFTQSLLALRRELNFDASHDVESPKY